MLGRRLELQSSTMNMLMFLGGLILLVIGASTLVRGASKLALSFGISRSFGTHHRRLRHQRAGWR